MNLLDVFMAAMEAQITVEFPDKKTYDNLRTSLVRKLRKYNETQSSYGLPSDTYLKTTFNSTTNTGTFNIVSIEDRLRKQSYTLYDL